MSKWQRKEIILAAMAEKGTPDNIGFNLTFKQPINEKKESEKNERILSHRNLCESKFIKRGKYNREKKKKNRDVNESVGFKNHRKMDFLPYNISSYGWKVEILSMEGIRSIVL